MGKTYRGEDREKFRKHSKNARKMRDERKNRRSLAKEDVQNETNCWEGNRRRD